MDQAVTHFLRDSQKKIYKPRLSRTGLLNTSFLTSSQRSLKWSPPGYSSELFTPDSSDVFGGSPLQRINLDRGSRALAKNDASVSWGCFLVGHLGTRTQKSPKPFASQAQTQGLHIDLQPVGHLVLRENIQPQIRDPQGLLIPFLRKAKRTTTILGVA